MPPPSDWNIRRRDLNILKLPSLFSFRRNDADVVTLGVQGVVIDPAKRILLVRHGYRPGWHFPGGGVERGEEILTALERELLEETGVALTAPPALLGLYANFEAFPGDHIALFRVAEWRRDAVPRPNAEIAESRFFSIDEIPADTVRGAVRRLDEIFRGAPQSDFW